MTDPASSRCPSTEPTSRRGLLRTVCAAALAGCATRSGDRQTPADLDAWPPSEHRDVLTLGHPWSGWAAWTADAFDAADVSVTPCNANGLDIDRSLSERLLEGHHGVSLLGAQDWWIEDRAGARAHRLPIDRLPGAAALSDRATDTAAFARPGRPRTVPLSVEPSVLAYDTTAFPAPPSSLSVLFDESRAGRVAVEGRVVNLRPMVAALALGQHPARPSDTDAIAEATARLYEQQYDGEVRASGRDYDRRQVAMLADGAVDVGVFPWHVAFAARFEADAPVEFVVPREGTLYRTHGLVVPRGAPAPLAALRLANWALQPRNAARLVTAAGRRPAVDVSDHVSPAHREFLSLPADRRYVHNDLLPEEVSVAYGEIERQVETT
jgi:ABC-type Fe3+ transport system substrate-binding protein